MLLINKKSTPLTVTLHGAGDSGVNTTAQVLDGSIAHVIASVLLDDMVSSKLTVSQVLDGSVDGKTLDPEPGFVPPVDREIGVDGVLTLGPYAVALVHAGKQ